MIIKDLIGFKAGLGLKEIQTIKRECSQFLQEAAGFPLYKSLPTSYYNFHKVKVRLQKKRDEVTDVFERAFGDEFSNIRQRSVFAYPSIHLSEDASFEPFYVFPVNGYRYLYSKEVTNSNAAYKSVVGTLFESFDDQQQASDIVSDLLKFTYSATNLQEGISANSEIIVYGIPYYYAVRKSACEQYAELFNTIK